MPENEPGQVIITTLDIWNELQKLGRRVERIERFVYTVTGGGIVVGSILGFVGGYIQTHSHFP